MLMSSKIRFCLILLAVLWLGACSVRAMSQEKDELNRLRDRFEQWDSKQQQIAIGLESRLVKLETNLDNLSRLLWGLCGAVALQLVETGWGLVMHTRDRRGKNS
jgi:hypothetical protein